MVKQRKKRKPRPVAERLTLKEAKKLLAIDRNDIDTELERHPTILAEVGSAKIQAEARRDYAKDEMMGAEADAYLHVRDNVEAKTTETAMKQEAKTDKHWLKAQKLYRDAKEEAGQWDVLWQAFNQRSFMLNKLAEIQTATFYTSDDYRPKYERKLGKR